MKALCYFRVSKKQAVENTAWFLHIKPFILYKITYESKITYASKIICNKILTQCISEKTSNEILYQSNIGV